MLVKCAEASPPDNPRRCSKKRFEARIAGTVGLLAAKLHRIGGATLCTALQASGGYNLDIRIMPNTGSVGTQVFDKGAVFAKSKGRHTADANKHRKADRKSRTGAVQRHGKKSPS